MLFCCLPYFGLHVPFFLSSLFCYFSCFYSSFFFYVFFVCVLFSVFYLLFFIFFMFSMFFLLFLYRYDIANRLVVLPEGRVRQAAGRGRPEAWEGAREERRKTTTR